MARQKGCIPRTTYLDLPHAGWVHRGSWCGMSTNASLQDESDTLTPSLYAAVDHRDAYEENIEGRHGKQLSLAYNEGHGKEYLDESLFDEYEEDEEDNMDDEEGTEQISLDEIDEDEVSMEGSGGMPSEYQNDGMERVDPAELAALRAGAPGGDVFAVLKLGASQHKVTVGDLVVSDKLLPVNKWKVGATLTLTDDDILLLGSPVRTLVGLPGVKGAEVKVMVEEITHDAKVIVFKKRRRKNSRRKNGFRREVTLVRILDITLPERFRDEPSA
eukprot:CAMPEP_0195518504 /NCGR_PEP_ID=MMETSP0794_2-20130614/13017_1 /TAXON_ID=515487 /ORGANISM="Stephanopyxis turris, Strain CCMP 815" /LENGTH=272 /DNA_ID=CAMNT_0040647475 /DNA_START=114 /DNA_END=932 /DNA_ORIENTATION=-